MQALKVRRSAGGRDPREIVLVRYPGRGGDAGEVWEGYVRAGTGLTLVGAAPASRRTPRYQKSRMKELSHVDAAGKASMVDVSDKPVSARSASARGHIIMRPETLKAIRDNTIAKGDVLGVARIAGIQAAKRTAELVPLCHQLPLTGVKVDFELDDALPGVRVTASTRTAAQTGVEMEAIVAVSVTLVTLYDMAKGVDKGMVIGEISLTEKRGGKSGDWVRDD